MPTFKCSVCEETDPCILTYRNEDDPYPTECPLDADKAEWKVGDGEKRQNWKQLSSTCPWNIASGCRAQLAGGQTYTCSQSNCAFYHFLKGE